MTTLPGPLSTAPQIVRDVPPGDGRTLLLVVAHADDPALFLGGTVVLWSRAGWRIVCLRVTDDAKDSVGLGEEETIRANAAEFAEAAALLGIARTEDIGLATDRLGDVSRVALRERIIHAIRRHRPYGTVTFDPYAVFGEDNLDHKVLAEAVDEAFWCAQFDKHHPEHLAEGLPLHGVCERWYFGRSVLGVTHVFDTAGTIDRQIEATLAHRTMLANIARQITLQATTAGRPAPLAEAAMRGDHRPLVEAMIRRSAAARGAPHGLAAAEPMRLNRPDFL